MFEGAIFDMDGVIVDSHPAHKEAWRRTLFAAGKRVSDVDLEFVTDGGKLAEILAHFLGTVSDSEIEQYGAIKNRLFGELASEVCMIKGVREFLGALTKARILLAVATCAGEQRTFEILDRFGLTPCFTAIVTGNQVERGKPDPSIFLLAAQRLSVRLARAVVFEDAASGVRAAKKAGMVCVGIGAGDRSQLLRGAGADLVISDFSEFALPHLTRLFGRSGRLAPADRGL